MDITVYEFRASVDTFTKTLPHVVKADLAQIERLIPVIEFGELFGGYLMWDPPEPSSDRLKGSSIGVWGLRNGSRFRRVLRERGARLERVKGSGPTQRIRRIAKFRSAPS